MDVSTKIIRILTAVMLLCTVVFCCTGLCYADDSENYTMEDGTVLTYTYQTAKAVSLTGVTPGEGVEDLVLPGEFDGKRLIEIGEDAFDRCGSLKTLTIPRTVTYISSSAAFRTRALEGCTSLESITVDEENPAYFSRDGVLFRYGYDDYGNADCTKGLMKSLLVFYPPEKPDSYYMIPFGVHDIMDLRSNHLKTLEVPGKLNNYFYEDPEDLPVLDTVVFYQDSLGFRADLAKAPQKTIVLGNGNRLSQYYGREAHIVSFAGSDAESWAEEMGYSFTALPKPKIKFEGINENDIIGRFIDDSPTFRVKIDSDMPFETASENEDVAVMDQNGTVTVKKPGTTRLHAYIRYDGEHLPVDQSFTLVINKVYILAKKLDYVIESGTRTVQLIPIDQYPDLKLKYESEDESKLTVDQNGKVTVLTTKPGRYHV